MNIEKTVEQWREYTITTIKVGEKSETSYSPLMPKDVWDEYMHEKLKNLKLIQKQQIKLQSGSQQKVKR